MKNLLLVTTRFPHKDDPISSYFVYSQLEELKVYFDKVMVISVNPYTPRFLCRWLKPSRKLDSMAEDYSYDNVEVYYTKNIVLPVKTLKKMLRGGQAYRAINKILNKSNFTPDIIHAHFSWPPGYAAVHVAEDRNIPCVITIHENHDWLIEEKSEGKLVETWRKADALIRVNKLDVPFLKKYSNNVFSIPNGFLHEKFYRMDRMECRKKLNLPEDKFISFSLGHLIERKGFHDLLEAVRIIVKKKRNVLFVIGGDGPMKEKLIEKIDKYGLHENVKLLGYISDDEKPLWINASNVFILPSYSEGNPTVMFEALGCGKPFIGTAVGGVPEIINNEKLGIVLQPGDIEGLANAVIRTIDRNWDETYILEYAKQFTWENIAKQVYDIYKLLV